MKTKALLFDMDGVLVDVSQSYRQVVKITAGHFLHREISLETIQQYKNKGGLNNDWDLTERILLDDGMKVDKEEIIRVFQQFYLGKNHDGAIQREKWLLSPGTATWAGQHFHTGIVTGRPREDARYTLERFGAGHFFPVMVAMEDVPRHRGKPDPMGILLALEKLRATQGWYIGDTIDDMVAGQKAGLTPIGVVGGQEITHRGRQEELMRQYGAADIIADVNQVVDIIKNA